MTGEGRQSRGEAPLLSFVVLAYNQERFIRQTLDSFTRQGLDSYEIVVCDDCSADDTAAAVADWATRNPSVYLRYLRNDPNRGTVRNYVNGFRSARGRYLKFIAADDYLVPGAIAPMLDAMRKNGFAAAFSSIVFLEEGGSESVLSSRRLAQAAALGAAGAERQHYRLLTDNLVFAPAVLVEKARVEAALGALEGFRLMEDWPLWLELTRRGIRIGFFEDPTVVYRIHPGCVSVGPGLVVGHRRVFKRERLKMLERNAAELRALDLEGRVSIFEQMAELRDELYPRDDLARLVVRIAARNGARLLRALARLGLSNREPRYRSA